jgi:hypothetical protein
MIRNLSYFAVWQPGSGAQHWQHDLDADGLKSMHAAQAKKGRHLIAVDIWVASRIPTRRSYIGVWQAGVVKQWLEPTLSIEDFGVLDTAHFKKGRRLTAFDIDDLGLICAVWQAGSGPERVVAGWPWVDFNDLATKQHKAGRRLTVFRQHGPDSFAGVWHPGSGPQWLHTAMSENECKGADTAYFNSGLRMNSLDEYHTRLNAVWGPGKGTQWVRWNKTFDEVKNLDDGFFADGLRLKVLKRAGVGEVGAHK